VAVSLHTHILNLDTPCRCGLASFGGRFNVPQEHPVAKGQKTVDLILGPDVVR